MDLENMNLVIFFSINLIRKQLVINKININMKNLK